MTGVAAQIESCVPAASLGGVQTCVVTVQAQVLGCSRAGRPLQKIVGLACGMWIVACEAIPCRLVVHMTAGLCAFFIVMTLQTKLGGSCGEKFNAGDVLGNAHLMATQAVLFGSRMSVLVFRFLLVTAQAGCRVGIRVQLGWMLLCCNHAPDQRDEDGKQHSHDCPSRRASRAKYS